jgi:hypothetical protein
VAGKTRITIHTEFEAEPGIMGFIGKLMSPPMLRKIYRQELQNLDAYMQQQSV